MLTPDHQLLSSFASAEVIKRCRVNGVELQNSNAVTFTPTMLFVNALDKLRSAIRYYSPLIKWSYSPRVECEYDWTQSVPSDICDLPTPVALSSSDNLRLFTLAALRFTEITVKFPLPTVANTLGVLGVSTHWVVQEEAQLKSVDKRHPKERHFPGDSRQFYST